MKAAFALRSRLDKLTVGHFSYGALLELIINTLVHYWNEKIIHSSIDNCNNVIK